MGKNLRDKILQQRSSCLKYFLLYPCETGRPSKGALFFITFLKQCFTAALQPREEIETLKS